MEQLDAIVVLLAEAACRDHGVISHRMAIPKTLPVSQHVIYNQRDFSHLCCDSRDCPYKTFEKNMQGQVINYCIFDKKIQELRDN